MNSFFGNVQAPADGNFDTSIQNIPKDTKVNALIEESKWERYTPDVGANAGIEQVFIKNTWTIIDGEYQNRKLFQKVYVQEMDQGKKERALKMLAAIDANCGGKIMTAGVMPDDMMLSMSLCNVPMTLTVGEWKNDSGATGNHVTAISRLQAPVAPTMQQQAQHNAPQPTMQQRAHNVVHPQQAPAQDVNEMQPQNMNAQQLQQADVQAPAPQQSVTQQIQNIPAF